MGIASLHVGNGEPHLEFQTRRVTMSSKASDKDERIYRTILVPLDGSEAAEAVLELAKNLAVRSGAALMLLHVCRPEQADYERLHSAYIERVADLVQRDISKICETVQCHFEGVKAIASPVLLNGEPVEEIVRYAEENEVSMILMATHGRSGLAHSVMSDTTNRIVRNALVPVWLMRTLGPDEIVCAEWPLKRVLVPLDGSERAEKVLPYAADYAKLFDAELVLMRVCEQAEITADYPEASRATSWDEHVRQVSSHYQAQCSVYLEVVKDRLQDMGLKVTTEALLGDAAEEIIGYIRQNRCDLVAMTTYGRTGMARWVADSLVGRWVFSNVTEQVLAATSRGILLVRGQESSKSKIVI